MLEGLDIEKEIASLGENIQCYVEVLTITDSIRSVSHMAPLYFTGSYYFLCF